jgi:hypothetical protein
MQIKKILEKFNTIVKKPVFWVVLLILTTSIVFIPALRMEFWWVDDGWNIMMAQKIINSIVHADFGGLNIIFAESNGRFRIMYWFYQTFEYLIGGTNPTLHFFVHYLVILLSAFLIFRIVILITKSNLSAFVSSVLFVITRINTENLYRLGPQEPILSLFLIVSIFFLVKSKSFLSILFLFLATLTKENGFILWIPVFCFYLGKRILFKKRDLILEKYCLWGFIFSIPFVLNTFLRNGGYSSNYVLDVNQIVGNFGTYILSIKTGFSPFFTIFSATYLIRLIICFRSLRYNNLRYKKLRLGLLYQGMFMLLFLLFIVVQSPWAFVLDRYLMPATVGLVIFIGLEIAGVKEILLMQKVRRVSWLTGAFTAFLFIFITVNTIQIYNYARGFVHNTRFIQSLYSNLANEVPQNGVVLLNFLKGDSTIELVVQTGMQLDLLYHRPDIQVSYLNLDDLPKGRFIIVGTPLIREEYPRLVVEKSIGNYRKDETLVQKDKFLVLTTPIELFKQVIKKVFQFVIYKKPLSSDGIYTFATPRDFWYKYYIGE